MTRKIQGTKHRGVPTRLKSRATFKRYIPEDCHVMIELNGEIKATPPVPFERVLGLMHLIINDFYTHVKAWDVRILFDDDFGTVRSYKNVFGAISLMKRLPVDGEYYGIKAIMLGADSGDPEPVMSVLTDRTTCEIPSIKLAKKITNVVVNEILTWEKMNLI